MMNTANSLPHTQCNYPAWWDTEGTFCKIVISWLTADKNDVKMRVHHAAEQLPFKCLCVAPTHTHTHTHSHTHFSYGRIKLKRLKKGWCFSCHDYLGDAVLSLGSQSEWCYVHVTTEKQLWSCCWRLSSLKTDKKNMSLQLQLKVHVVLKLN